MSIPDDPRLMQAQIDGATSLLLEVQQDCIAQRTRADAAEQETHRLRGWLMHIRWGVGFFERASPTRDRMLAAVDAALRGEGPPGAKEKEG